MGVPPLVLNMTMEMSFDNLTAETKIPKTSQYRMSPLHEVLWFNNTDDIEEFIKTSSEENEIGDLLRTYDRDARSPLMYAIINKNTKALKLLLEAGAPVNYQDPQQGYTALIYAIYHGFREGVEILLSRDINVNFTTKGRKPTTPLLFAAARGYSQTVAKLLDKGADINATFPVDEETQFNALMVAMHSEEITDLPIRQAVCEILIAHGINTLIPRSDGCSPMMCAIDKRMVDVAKLLIEKGITNIDKVAKKRRLTIEVKKNDKCTTALWVSMQRKNLECVKLLMDNNVKIQTGKSRSSPLHAAVISNFTEGVQILLDHDHPLMWMDNDGFTPIHYAACFDDTTVLEMLLKKGLNIEVKAKKSGYTPLVIACLKGNVNGIKKLLDYNASIEAFDKKDGVTPLIATIIENKLEATEYLISRGANIMGRRGGKGITPLMNAIGLQRTSIRNLILAHAKEKAEKKGELKKQGGGHRSKAWKKRYFVLYGTYFLYYKDERAVEPQGIIVLDGCDVTDSSKGALHFVIVTPRRSYQIQSKSEEERNSWFQFLSTAVKSYQKPDDLPAQSFGAEGKVPDTNVNS